MKWLPKWKKYTEVKCPNGVRRVYDDVNDVFPMYFGSANIDGNASIKVAGQVDAALSGAIQTKLEHLLLRIDEKNASMVAHFRAAYLVYAAAPCEKLEYLESAVTAIREDERSLRLLELGASQIVKLLKAKPEIGLEAVGHQLDALIVDASRAAITDNVAAEMREVSDITKQWQKNER